MNEDLFCKYVKAGIFEIDDIGQVWRKSKMIWSRARNAFIQIPCAKKRAERIRAGYLEVSMKVCRKTLGVLAHRLAWFHFHGPIPEGLTINHIDGIKTNNAPENGVLLSLTVWVRAAAGQACFG